jgi:hypothetical protein
MNRRHAIWLILAVLFFAAIAWRRFESPHSTLSMKFVGYEGSCAIFRITNDTRYVYCGHSTTKPLVTGNTMDGLPWDVPARGVATICIPVRRTDVAWELQLSFARQSILRTNWARRPELTLRSLVDFARGRARVHFAPWPTNVLLTLRSDLIQPAIDRPAPTAQQE